MLTAVWCAKLVVRRSSAVLRKAAAMTECRVIDGRSAAASLRSGYDYVIVGSGSAGSVLAARLAAAGSDRVLLLEAGPSDRHIYIRMPAAFGMPLVNDRFNWFYRSEPEPHLDGREIVE